MRATLRQAEAICKIWKRQGKEPDFGKAIKLSKSEASRIISQNYLSFYAVREKVRKDRR